jgi:hypothetical protein
MARKTLRVTITDEGRDKGKTFVLTELPADQAERWFIRALLGLAQSGADISPEQMAGGAAAFAALGVQALGGIAWPTLEPLLDEMFECVQCIPPDPRYPAQAIIPGANSQIEEVKTRFALRVAVLELHIGFSLPGVTPTSGLSLQGPEQEGEESSQPTFLGSLVSWYRKAFAR